MPKIINTYAQPSTLADALRGFAGSFGANTPQTEFARQKAYELSRGNQYLPLSADALRRGDTRAAAYYGYLAGQDPKMYAGANRFIAATTNPVDAPVVTQSMLGAGDSFATTPIGVNRAEANRRAIENLRTQRQYDAARYKTNNTPTSVLVDGIAKLYPQSEALSKRMTPVQPLGQVQGDILQQDMPTLTPEQRAAAGGYAPKNPANLWVGKTADGKLTTTADGKTSLQTGEPIVGPVQKLEGPTTDALTPDKTDNRAQRQLYLQNNDVVNMADRILSIVQKDPTVVGPTGNVRRLSQNIVDTLNNVGVLFGDANKFNSTISEAQNDAMKQGVDPKLLPGLFDPQASNVVKLNTLLLYKAAAALAGQAGRAISDRDIEHLTTIVGDPTKWIEGSQQYLHGVRLIRDIAAGNRDNAKRVLDAGTVTAVQPPPTGTTREQLKQKYGLE